MDTQPAVTEPNTDFEQEAQLYRAILQQMVEIGAGTVRRLYDHAQAQAALSEPPVDITEPYDRITRSIRRSILVARKLAEPLPAAPVRTDRDRTVTRQRIIRDVEDVIQRGFSDEDEESLHAELLDRMDGPDIAEDIDTRPVAAIILDICRDLGLESMPGNHPWTRRRPDDIAVLQARAAGHRVPGGSPYPRTGKPPPLSDAELVDILLPGGRRCR